MTVDAALLHEVSEAEAESDPVRPDCSTMRSLSRGADTACPIEDRGYILRSVANAAAGIAHDIRNPLHVIVLEASAMILQPDCALTPATVRKEADKILLYAQRAERIAGDLSLLAEDSIRLDDEIDINSLTQGCLLLVREQFEKKQIQAESSLDPNLSMVAGCSVALERVLMNVLTNAIEALVNGGRIRIATGQSAGTVQMMISDNGPGIAPEAVSHVFDLRYTTKQGGRGLGLWLSRRIIEQHRGTISVVSELGKGASFEISLPETPRRL
jgi:signal transduction histidine kinase